MNIQDRHIQAQILRMLIAIASGNYDQKHIVDDCTKYLVQVVGMDIGVV